MNIKINTENDILIVELEGRIDSNNAPDFESQVLGAIGDEALKMVIDFSGMDYISSSGLRVVLMAAKRIKQAQGNLVLCGLSETIHEVFEISGFLNILTVCKSRSDALKIV